MPSASCQSSVTLQRGTSAKGQQRVEERALGLLSEAKLGAMWHQGWGDTKGNFL